MLAGLFIGAIAHVVILAATAAIWARYAADSKGEARANRVLDFLLSWEAAVSFMMVGALVGVL